MPLLLTGKLNTRLPSILAPISLALLLGFSPVLLADDVNDQIEEAIKAYEKEDYNTAITALNAASTLIRQKKGELVSRLLPEPLSGWKAGAAKSSAAAAGIFGGGISAERRYTRKDDGKALALTISITTDSPLIQTMSMMFSNPMFMGQNNKLTVINGEKAIANERDNSLTSMVSNKVLVKVDGDKKVSPETLKEYFKSINFKAIKEYAQ
ncbi:hypothetical protein BMS3Bbin11_00481 [bacterium BMS3Bbin11]|nr:hypothetical protein BMS3Abin11_02402 [bacterium BMS3Abin11]GBE45395.1 hypothetical protein BMS3Bbin11_00481 [bacterium BMS3Bbin11]GMT41228.1 MAG: hypothetical protein IEMM0001_1963 [bacterium]HDH15105.1 hypothetical protein [Gammaproteobacteria bacterium]HDZ78012.1 hypothetical protein [Gammaproteobacteria bacterium]